MTYCIQLPDGAQDVWLYCRLCCTFSYKVNGLCCFCIKAIFANEITFKFKIIKDKNSVIDPGCFCIKIENLLKKQPHWTLKLSPSSLYTSKEVENYLCDLNHLSSGFSGFSGLELNLPSKQKAV